MMIQQYRTEMKWAFYYAVFLLAWNLVERLTGLHHKYISLQQNLSILLLIPAVVFYILELLNKRKVFYKGNMTYVQGFFSGVIFTICIMILAPVVQAVSYFIISPHFLANLSDYSVAKGIFTKEQAAKQFNYGNFLFINEVFQMLSGVVFAAFIPLFMQIGRPNGES